LLSGINLHVTVDEKWFCFPLDEKQQSRTFHTFLSQHFAVLVWLFPGKHIHRLSSFVQQNMNSLVTSSWWLINSLDKVALKYDHPHFPPQYKSNAAVTEGRKNTGTEEGSQKLLLYATFFTLRYM
jgi:hypothetical protein